MGEMKPRSVRGSRPWMAMRKRRPQPAMARSGQAEASALITASMISLPQWLVHKVTGAPALAHTTVPGLAITLSGRKAPSFFGVSESIKYASAAATPARMLAYDELTKLVTSGSDADKSTVKSLPRFST